MLEQIAPEITGSTHQGEIRSENVPSLRHVVMISDKKYGWGLSDFYS